MKKVYSVADVRAYTHGSVDDGGWYVFDICGTPVKYRQPCRVEFNDDSVCYAESVEAAITAMNSIGTKTYKPLMVNATKALVHALGGGGVIIHKPTPENQIGQSGVHTFINDLQDIIDANFDSPQKLNRALFDFFNPESYK
jgi:hypothetical protein